MCLTIDFNKTEEYRAKNRNKETVTVWKLVRKNGDQYQTPYRYVKFKNKLTAGKEIDIKMNKCTTNGFIVELYAGVIHCYSTRAIARRMNRPWYTIIKCKAYMRDFLYCGLNGDIAFKEIRVVN